MSGLWKQLLMCLWRNCWVNCIHFYFLFVVAKARVMDRMALGYTHAVDTNFYEYCSNDFLPIDISVLDLDQEGVPFHPRSLVLDQLSSQGTNSQQSSLPQKFYRTSSKQSSLTSSQGVAISVVFLCLSESQNIDWLMAQEQRQSFCQSVSQHLPPHWGNVCMLSCI